MMKKVEEQVLKKAGKYSGKRRVCWKIFEESEKYLKKSCKNSEKYSGRKEVCRKILEELEQSR